jgi:ring-1,2-phenylacetyl-CoA epoxidase subunit PaaC
MSLVGRPEDAAVAETEARPGAGALPAAGALPDDVRDALAELLLALADDELVIGFVDSEWTGIAPLLEEDVAMSSLAQDELGHARALYELLGGLTGRDPDAIAYDRPAADFRHARLLDGWRGDWATTIARRYLYDTADAVRLEAMAGSSWRPLAELAAKVRREETYHLLHAEAWLLRLADGGDEPGSRLAAALRTLGAEAWSVLAPLPGEPVLLEAGVLPLASAELDRRWRSRVEPVLRSRGLPLPVAAPAGQAPRAAHGDAFDWLHGELTAVRRLDPAAAW